ncbi:uncharacterized protein LY89DRAFT_677639 [Mollisia scopiformis]|uniref:SprT-like domain-containing protein n=1 Tax=Mollisia scopiformis TaxID=149040 RepID=A0A132B6A7_MOLSC|nr:uncharacterized protein LY89DRAFT_677639 [Mollisia scopiformis]KUJ07871.1 hypothetical protein LY89DRAFT_677639 [Mollisia scopiformis]
MLKALRKVVGGRTSPQPTPAKRDRHHRHYPTTTYCRGRHSSHEVAKTVIDFAKRRGSTLHERQRVAISRYRSDNVFNTRNAGNHSEGAIFEAYFKFFDLMFFGGILKLGCKVVLTGKDVEKMNAYGVASTHGKLVNGRPKGVYGNIRIHNASHLKNPRDRRLAGLSTLLHEMLHCFLDFYTCFRSDCRDRFEDLGQEHGIAWQDAAYALEECVRDPTFINLPLVLGRRLALVNELNEWGHPKICDLRRWGFTKREVRFIKGKWRLLKLDDACAS